MEVVIAVFAVFVLLLLFKLANFLFVVVEVVVVVVVVVVFVLLLLNVRCFDQCSTSSSDLNSPDSQSPPVDDSELDASGLSDGVCASTNEFILDVR